jgi:O-methyltransferase
MGFLKSSLKRLLPPVLLRPLIALYRLIESRDEATAVLSFLLRRYPHTGFMTRLRLLKQMYVISFRVECPHSQREVLAFIRAILNISPELTGCIVEAGSYKGGSTAKFSLAARLANRRLVVFDSFEGIPEHAETHTKDIFGRPVGFAPGSYSGSLEQVRSTIRRFGCLEACEFVKGWFDETLPRFDEPIAAAYLDVDLASSTRTCLRNLYPKIVNGGVLYSQDGHLPLVLEAFTDNEFWERDIGARRPDVEGLGTCRLIRLTKRSSGPSRIRADV